MSNLLLVRIFLICSFLSRGRGGCGLLGQRFLGGRFFSSRFFSSRFDCNGGFLDCGQDSGGLRGRNGLWCQIFLSGGFSGRGRISGFLRDSDCLFGSSLLGANAFIGRSLFRSILSRIGFRRSGLGGSSFFHQGFLGCGKRIGSLLSGGLRLDNRRGRGFLRNNRKTNTHRYQTDKPATGDCRWFHDVYLLLKQMKRLLFS